MCLLTWFCESVTLVVLQSNSCHVLDDDCIRLLKFCQVSALGLQFRQKLRVGGGGDGEAKDDLFYDVHTMHELRSLWNFHWTEHYCNTNMEWRRSLFRFINTPRRRQPSSNWCRRRRDFKNCSATWTLTKSATTRAGSNQKVTWC